MNRRLNRFTLAFALWVLTLALFPIPAPLVAQSFRIEVLSRVSSLAAHGAAPREEPQVELCDRVVVRLVEAEAKESDAWYRDDYRIARVTMGLVRTGSPIPYIEATYTVLGIHPDQVWPRIVARRGAMLGAEYSNLFGGISSPRKPARSVMLAEALETPTAREPEISRAAI